MRSTGVFGRVRSRFADNWPLIVMSVLVVAFVLFFSYLAIMRHMRLQSHGYDLGNYDQAIWNTAHGRPFEFTNWRGKDEWFLQPTRLGMHVEPILLLIAPLYWLWEDVRVLLILQALVVGLGGVGIWLLARWKFGERVGTDSGGVRAARWGQLFEWAALLMAAAFLLNTTFQWTVLGDFHGVTLVAGLAPFAFYFMLRQRYGWFLVFAVLIAATKEDMPLLVALMGLYILIFQGWRGSNSARRKDALLVGSLTFIAGVAWFVVAFFLIIPHFNSGGASPYFARYQDILGAEGLTLTNIPKMIESSVGVIFSAESLQYVAGLLLPSAFLALFDWPILLIGAPSLAINLLSENTLQRFLGSHHAVSLATLVMVATVTGIVRFTTRGRDRRSLWGKLFPSRMRLRPTSNWYFILTIIVLSITLIVQYWNGATPLARAFTWPTMTPHYRLAQRFFAQIPPDASVSVQQSLNPHLTQRRQITMLPFDASGEYLLIDLTRDWPYSNPDLHEWLSENVVQRPGYGIVDAADGFMLLQRGAPEQAIPNAFYDLFRAAEATPQYPMQVDFGDAIRFLGFDVRGGEKMDLYFQALQPLDRDLFITLYLTDADYQLRGGIEKKQVALLWFPTSQWTPGEVVRIPVRHMPWDSKELGTFSVALGVLEGDDLWNASLRLPPTLLNTGQNPRRLADGTLWHLMKYRWQGHEVIPLPDPVLDAPPPTSTRTDAQFGDLARLEGYEVHTAKPKPGDELAVDLYWRALEPTDVSYTIFFQVVGPDGRIYAQQDSPPGVGTLPTDNWQSGDLIPDAYHPILAENAPPGDYSIVVGFYDLATGERIALSGSAETFSTLPGIHVEESQNR